MKAYPNKSKYLEIAESLMEKIIEGDLVPGGHIPSVRETAIRMGVTPNTAANAHARLRDMGIIRPVHGTGSVVVNDAPEICRAYMERQFIEHEIPAIGRRIALLGLSGPQVLRLLKKASAFKGAGTEEER